MAPTAALAQKVALLPLADLSQGVNGINLPLTSTAFGVLERTGMELVPLDQVLSFMNENRMRVAGVVDSYMARKIGDQFRCKVLLVGTVTEFGGRDPALGFTFSALDATKGKVLWGGTVSSSISEQVRLLGIGQPEKTEELAQPLLTELFSTLYQQIDESRDELHRTYRLEGMRIDPAYARGGDEVEGTLKIKFLGAKPSRVAIEKDGGVFELTPDGREGVYRGRWRLPDVEGTYPVHLLLDWEKSKTHLRIEQVASFTVINEAPQFRMEIRRGVPVGEDVIAFRDQILVLPRLSKPRPLARWAIEIADDAGVVLEKDEIEGEIPERMVWEGRTGEGNPLPDRTYKVTLRVWDLAGNEASDTRKLAIQASARSVGFTPLVRDGKNYLKLDYVMNFGFPLDEWSLEILDPGGKSLVSQSGTTLPQEVELPEVTDEARMLINFDGRDFLGNRSRIRKKEMVIKGTGKKVEKAKDWVSDF